MGVSLWGIVLSFVFISTQSLAAGSAVVQQKKQLRGKVEISVADDFANKKSLTRFFVKDKATGKRTEVKFKKGKQPSWIAPSQEIIVSGTTESSGSLSADAAALVTDSTSTSTTSTSGSTTVTSGSPSTVKVVKSTLIIIADMDGGTGGILRRDAETAMYGSSNSVRDLYLKNSAGKLEFIADANGDGKSDIYNVKLTASLTAGCNDEGWASEAVNLAQQSYGVNPNDYTYHMIILPKNIPCFWNGLAWSKIALIKGYDGANTTFVMAHELGHLMGMGHAAIDSNNDGVVDSEYGDSSCDMGNDVPDLRFVNGPHAYQQGFYADFSGKVQTVTASQTIEVFPLEASPSNTSGAQIVRVPRVGTSEYYYLTLRSATSYAKALPSQFAEGLSIHRAGATPYYSYFVQTLNAGQVFQDISGGVRISAVKKNSGSIVISIEVSADAGCISRPPTVTLYSNVITSNQSSGHTGILMDIVNNDSMSCGSTQFGIAPSSLAVNVGSTVGSVYKIAPGSKQNIYYDLSYSVTSSGKYPIDLKVSDVDGVAPVHSDVVSSVSLVLDLNPPTAPQALTVVAGTKGRAELSWQASVDQEGPACYAIFENSVNGLNQVGSTCDTKFIAYPSLSVVYTVRAYDAAGNYSGYSNEVPFAVRTRSKR